MARVRPQGHGGSGVGGIYITFISLIMTISYPYIITFIYELRSASACLMKDLEI